MKYLVLDFDKRSNPLIVDPKNRGYRISLEDIFLGKYEVTDFLWDEQHFIEGGSTYEVESGLVYDIISGENLPLIDFLKSF